MTKDLRTKFDNLLEDPVFILKNIVIGSVGGFALLQLILYFFK